MLQREHSAILSTFIKLPLLCLFLVAILQWFYCMLVLHVANSESLFGGISFQCTLFKHCKCIQDTLFIDRLKVIPNNFQNNRVVVNLNKYKIQSYHFAFSGRSCHVI